MGVKEEELLFPDETEAAILSIFLHLSQRGRRVCLTGLIRSQSTDAVTHTLPFAKSQLAVSARGKFKAGRGRKT